MRELELRVQSCRRAQQEDGPLLDRAPATTVTKRVPDEVVVGIYSLDSGEPGINLQEGSGRNRRIAHAVLESHLGVETGMAPPRCQVTDRLSGPTGDDLRERHGAVRLFEIGESGRQWHGRSRQKDAVGNRAVPVDVQL